MDSEYLLDSKNELYEEDCMEFSLILAEQVLVMFLLLLAGGILYKCRIVKEEGLKQMTDVLLYLVMPFLILDTYQIEYNAELTFNMLLGFALSVGCIVLSIFLTQALRFGAKKEQLTTEQGHDPHQRVTRAGSLLNKGGPAGGNPSS